MKKELKDFTLKELITHLESRGVYYGDLEDIISEAKPKPKYQKNELEQPENVDLFVEYSDKLKWHQWNRIFKEVARKPFKERQKMPHDYSLLLNETIS